jgi:hypothetical protein
MAYCGSETASSLAGAQRFQVTARIVNPTPWLGHVRFPAWTGYRRGRRAARKASHVTDALVVLDINAWI